MNNITNISPTSIIHLQFTAWKMKGRKDCGDRLSVRKKLSDFQGWSTLKSEQYCSPDRPNGEIQGADIPMWSVIRKQIKDACRLAIEGFLLRSVSECSYSERLHYISIRKYAVFKIKPKCPSQQSHQRIQKP